MAFAIAWLSALALSWWVYKKSAAPEERAVARVVAAAKDLTLGQKLAAADLKLITLDQTDVPQGSFADISEVTERALTSRVSASEPILESKLAPKGAGEGLTAMIEPGMRAVAVQVTETSAVGGFIQPGARVDVLFTRTFTNGDAATRTILQNIKVIAYGRQISAAPPLEAPARETTRDTRGPTVVTLLVTQEEAEMITLAMQRGKIQLSLRSPLDTEVLGSDEVIESADLGIPEPVRARRDGFPEAETESATAAARKKATGDGEIVVKVYRGSEVTEETFAGEPAK